MTTERISTRDAYGAALLALGEHIESLVVVDADVASSTRASGLTWTCCRTTMRVTGSTTSQRSFGRQHPRSRMRSNSSTVVNCDWAETGMVMRWPAGAG